MDNNDHETSFTFRDADSGRKKQHSQNQFVQVVLREAMQGDSQAAERNVHGLGWGSRGPQGLLEVPSTSMDVECKYKYGKGSQRTDAICLRREVGELSRLCKKAFAEQWLWQWMYTPPFPPAAGRLPRNPNPNAEDEQ